MCKDERVIKERVIGYIEASVTNAAIRIINSFIVLIIHCIYSYAYNNFSPVLLGIIEV